MNSSQTPDLRSWHTWVGFVVGFVGVVAIPVAIDSAVGVPAPSQLQARAAGDILTITEALQRFHDASGRVPTTDEGLEPLVPTYLEQVPPDPWGNPYLYTSAEDVGGVDVLTLGSDNRPGGAGDAADLSSLRGLLAPPPLIPPAVSSMLINAGYFVLPAIGLLRGHRWRWALGALAGAAALCAVFFLGVALLIVSQPLAAVIPALLGVCCIAACIATLRGTRGARAVTFAVIAAAFFLLPTMLPRVRDLAG